jgi:hypothetical protein
MHLRPFDPNAMYRGAFGHKGEFGTGVHLGLPGAQILPGHPGGLRITQRRRTTVGHWITAKRSTDLAPDRFAGRWSRLKVTSDPVQVAESQPAWNRVAGHARVTMDKTRKEGCRG